MSKKELTGIVLRKSGAKTVAVQVVRTIQHKKYGKSMASSKTYLAHDEADSAEIGQQVVIQESRPLSARKRWVLVTPQA